MGINVKYSADSLTDYIPLNLEYTRSKYYPDTTFLKIFDMFSPLFNNGYQLAVCKNDCVYASGHNPDINFHIVSSTDHNENAFNIKLFLKYRPDTNDFYCEIRYDDSYVWTRKDKFIYKRKIRRNMYEKYLGFYSYYNSNNCYVNRLSNEHINKFVKFINTYFGDLVQNNKLEAKKCAIENNKFKLNEDDVRLFIDSINEVINPYNAKCHFATEIDRPSFRVFINNNFADEDLVEAARFGDNFGKYIEMLDWWTGSNKYSYMSIKLSYQENKWVASIEVQPYYDNKFMTEVMNWKTFVSDNIEDVIKYYKEQFKKSHDLYQKIYNVVFDK